MRVLKALITIVFLLIVLGGFTAGAGWFWLRNEIARPGPSQVATPFMVERGEGLARLAPRLESAGIVRDARVVRLAARLSGQEAQIKAGEYDIPAGASVSEVLDLLATGKVVLHRITIPEGLTVAQIFRLIDADPVLSGPLPAELPPEGSLLPDTYTFSRGMSRSELVTLMAREQSEMLQDLWNARAEGLPVATPQEALILASVVQEEAAGQDEYGLVASVFVNRLRRGMRLQSDPTVIYGVSQGEPLFNKKGERRTLYRSELDRDTDWNTYTRDGLPLTPICNPGKGALEAVLNPPETDFLFFVATGAGGHAFAATLREHERNVAAYRRFEAAEIAREREP